LTLLPFVLGLTLLTVNRGFLSVLWTDPLGIKMSIIALCMMVLGIFAMSRIIKIRV
jgi:tight adherence protein B